MAQASLLEAYLASCSARRERPLEELAAALSQESPIFQMSGGTLGELSSSSLGCITDALRSGHSFAEAELAGLGLPEAGADELLFALAAYPGFARLSISECGLGDAAVGTVLNSVRAGRLTTLQLRSNGIGNCGVASIAEAVAASATLRTLDLQRNEITCQGAIGLAAALQVNGTLQVVNLRFNQVCDAGATALAKVLGRNRTMLELHLGGNHVGSEGASQLGAALESNASLRVLNLRSNKVGDVGAVALGRMCRRNSRLSELYLGCNAIRESGTAAIAHALHGNSALSKLDLQGAAAGKPGSAALAEALKVFAQKPPRRHRVCLPSHRALAQSSA
jgi:Ran GTPase-activating protein (RanGAP) involved in mRNA processing and transport